MAGLGRAGHTCFNSLLIRLACHAYNNYYLLSPLYKIKATHKATLYRAKNCILFYTNSASNTYGIRKDEGLIIVFQATATLFEWVVMGYFNLKKENAFSIGALKQTVLLKFGTMIYGDTCCFFFIYYLYIYLSIYLFWGEDTFWIVSGRISSEWTWRLFS